jgi:hypothetical protein
MSSRTDGIFINNRAAALGEKGEGRSAGMLRSSVVQAGIGEIEDAHEHFQKAINNFERYSLPWGQTHSIFGNARCSVWARTPNCNIGRFLFHEECEP